MDAPPGKTLIKLADGRTIMVASADAAAFDYYSESGKVLRRPKAAAPPPTPAAPPPAPKPAAPAAPPPAPAPRPAAPAPPPAPPPRPAAAPPAPPPPPPPPRAAPPPAPRPAAAPARAPPRTMPARGPALDYNARALIVGALLVGTLLLLAPVLASYAQLIRDLSPCTVNSRQFPQTAEINVTRNFGIAAPGGEITYHLTLAQPYDISGMQTLLGVEVSPTPTAADGRLWWNRTLAQGAQDNISVRYNVLMTTKQWALTDADVGTKADVPASYTSVYLDEEWKINPNSSTVQRLAKQITDPSKSYLQQLKDIYTYLLCPPYHYALSSNFEPKSPEETVQGQAGDCDDFSVLFISIARYLGIPAWLELGLLYDEIRGAWGAHGWADVYIPLKTGGGVVVTVDVVNKLFLIRDPYHFSDWSSDGDAAHLQSYYTLLTYGPATTPPLQVTQSITSEPFRTEGVVNYFNP